MTTFEGLKIDRYYRVQSTPFHQAHNPGKSDIVLHLPVLEYYASLCSHVTEFGVRTADSTIALLSGCKGEMHSYDIDYSPSAKQLERIRDEGGLPCQWTFYHQDTLKAVIVPTEMLFVDTLHTYEHVKQELALHGRKASRFLVFHDTFTCGEKDLSGKDQHAKGILPAIYEFLGEYPGEYHTVYRTDACNGLWVLERIIGGLPS